ncbi:MAG: hypothetical protein MMC33_001541 [Icmadophila ericetorum]|nr:hypothetical protein [Icmadophila ericetorum]
MPSSIPHQAQTGFANASTYDTHRPSYPPSAVTALLTAMHLTSQNGARVIDLAAGTGKFTELLAKREEGFEILAIEPHEGMRKELDGKGLEGVKVVDGIAAEGGLGDVEKEWAEGVVVAQVSLVFAVEF